MFSNKKLSLIMGLLLVCSTGTSVFSQTAKSSTTVTTTTKTVVKRRPMRLKKRVGMRAKTHNTTTIVSHRSTLSGGVAKTHKHHMHTNGSAQAIRSAKLNAFLKNPPKMKKAPYFNAPGLNVSSSPAL